MTARELRPLGQTLGTEALGVDLSKPLDAETFAWIEATFAEHLEPLPEAPRRALRARLAGVTGIELWKVLRKAEGLSAEEATDAVADLLAACLTTPHGRES
jgi:hypothetical protein